MSGAARRLAGPGLRPTLIDLYLLRLLAGRTAGAFAVLFTVMLLERVLRLATQMAAAGAHMRFLPVMAWNLVPHYVALSLPDAFLIGMLMTIARLDEDLEIEAMLASGFSLGRVVGSLVAVGLSVAAVNLLFLGVLEPMGLYGYRVARDKALRAGWTAEAQPWAFQGRAGAVTLTADGADASGRGLTGLFIHRRSAGGVETVLTAQAGRLGLSADGRAATLSVAAGQVLVIRPDHAPTAGLFDNYSLTDPYVATGRPPVRGVRPQELTLRELAAAPPGTAGRAARSELYARIARSLALPLLPFLALPMAVAGRRGRRSAGMATAGGLALLFRQAERLAQRMGAVGRAPALAAMVAVFAVFTALTVWIFASNRRLMGDTPLADLLRRAGDLFSRRRAAPADPDAHATVGRYIRRAVARSVIAIGVTMVVLLGMIDLFERTEDILDRGFGLLGLAHYALLRAPVLAEQSVALATLVGATSALLRLTRGGEMVAVRALGLSLYQIARMVAPVGLVACLVSVALAEVAAPAAQLALTRWWASSPNAEAQPSERWFRVGGDLVEARAAAADGARLTGVTIYRRGGDGALNERIAADAAVWNGRSWRLTGVSSVRVGPASAVSSTAPAAPWRASMRPAEVVSMLARPPQIAAMAAARQLAGSSPTDLSRGYLVTRLHRALAEPLAPLIMLLLAVPLALTSAKTGPSLKSMTWVLGAGLIYVVTDGVFTAAGQTSMAPPWLAAWFAPVLFLSVAATAFVESEA